MGLRGQIGIEPCPTKYQVPRQRRQAPTHHLCSTATLLRTLRIRKEAKEKKFEEGAATEWAEGGTQDKFLRDGDPGPFLSPPPQIPQATYRDGKTLPSRKKIQKNRDPDRKYGVFVLFSVLGQLLPKPKNSQKKNTPPSPPPPSNNPDPDSISILSRITFLARTLDQNLSASLRPASLPYTLVSGSNSSSFLAQRFLEAASSARLDSSAADLCRSTVRAHQLVLLSFATGLKVFFESTHWPIVQVPFAHRPLRLRWIVLLAPLPTSVCLAANHRHFRPAEKISLRYQTYHPFLRPSLTHLPIKWPPLPPLSTSSPPTLAMPP